jgi:hypothetical protein
VRKDSPWEPETTTSNLALLRNARALRNEPFAPAHDAEQALRAKSLP